MIESVEITTKAEKPQKLQDLPKSQLSWKHSGNGAVFKIGKKKRGTQTVAGKSWDEEGLFPGTVRTRVAIKTHHAAGIATNEESSRLCFASTNSASSSSLWSTAKGVDTTGITLLLGTGTRHERA